MAGLSEGKSQSRHKDGMDHTQHVARLAALTGSRVHASPNPTPRDRWFWIRLDEKGLSPPVLAMPPCYPSIKAAPFGLVQRTQYY